MTESKYEVVIIMNDQNMTDKDMINFINANLVDVEIVETDKNTVKLSWITAYDSCGYGEIEEVLYYILLEPQLGSYKYERVE